MYISLNESNNCTYIDICRSSAALHGAEREPSSEDGCTYLSVYHIFLDISLFFVSFHLCSFFLFVTKGVIFCLFDDNVGASTIFKYKNNYLNLDCFCLSQQNLCVFASTICVLFSDLVLYCRFLFFICLYIYQSIPPVTV